MTEDENTLQSVITKIDEKIKSLSKEKDELEVKLNKYRISKQPFNVGDIISYSLNSSKIGKITKIILPNTSNDPFLFNVKVCSPEGTHEECIGIDEYTKLMKNITIKEFDTAYRKIQEIEERIDGYKSKIQWNKGHIGTICNILKFNLIKK